MSDAHSQVNVLCAEMRHLVDVADDEMTVVDQRTLISEKK